MAVFSFNVPNVPNVTKMGFNVTECYDVPNVTNVLRLRRLYADNNKE